MKTKSSVYNFCSKSFASLLALTFSQFSIAVENTTVFSLIDLRGLQTKNSDQTWVNGGLSPLRFDKDNEGLQLGQAFLGAKVDIKNGLSVEGYGSAYADDGEGLGINELFFNYKPLPKFSYRIRAKAGLFFPHISVENTSKGWTTKNMLTNSAINSWIGEEIKIKGLRLEIERPGKYHASTWDTAISASVFNSNDPAGSLLAWRGWAMHDRQVRYQEKIQFSDLPALQTGGVFSDQSPYFDVHRELDDRFGYSLSLSAKHTQQFQIKAYYYDNNADPMVLERGQYAWHTAFFHLGIISPRYKGLRFKSQYINGETHMGPEVGTRVESTYESIFALVEYTYQRATYSFRYDDFKIDDVDEAERDNNAQDGQGFTAAIALEHNKHFKTIFEALYVKDKNSARDYFAKKPIQHITQFQLALQWRL